jgi:hypothetical protein
MHSNDASETSSTLHDINIYMVVREDARVCLLGGHNMRESPRVVAATPHLADRPPVALAFSLDFVSSLGGIEHHG